MSTYADDLARLEDAEGMPLRAFVGGSVSSGSSVAGWPELRELPSTKVEAPAMTADLLPGVLRPWLLDISERMQVPLEMVAAFGLTATASLIGRRRTIRPKAVDEWTVVPNVWGLVVAPPGSLKSPTRREAQAPLLQLEAEAALAHEPEARDAAVEIASLEAREKALRARLQRVHEGNPKPADDTEVSLKADLSDNRDRLEAEKRRGRGRTYRTSDATVEKLLELLAENPSGFLYDRDEMVGFLALLDRADRAGDREFFLETWSGDGHYRQDRIGRGTTVAKALCLSIVGGTQPGKLAHYVAEATSDGSGADGLLQRFQLLVWPEERPWSLVDRAPDHQARAAVDHLYRRLDRLQEAEPLRFSEEAQYLFVDWLTELERRLRSAELRPFPGFVAHLAKYRSLMPSLALIDYLVEGGDRGPVPLECARRAANLCEYFEAHARKVYAVELGRTLDGAHVLAERITTGKIATGMTVRDIYRAGWSGLSTPEAVRDALDTLAGHGWLRVHEQKVTPAGGRPGSPVVEVSPNLGEEVAA